MKAISPLFFSLIFTLFCMVFIPGGQAQLSIDRRGNLDVQADSLDFDAATNIVTARGNVELRKGRQSLRADEIRYHVQTEQAHARGNVVFVNDGQIWEGEELNFNFITGEGDFPSLLLTFNPFRIRAEQAERLSPIHMQMNRVVLTTCDDVDNPEFAIRASRVDVYEDEVFALRNAVFYLRGIPFFYLPRLSMDQQRQATNLDVEPGYSSRQGFYVLTGYNRYPREGYRTKTHLDLRSERGIAVGQDFHWYDPVENRDHTRIRGYYANDLRPYRNQNEETRLREQNIDLDENRFRFDVFHMTEFSSNETLRARAAYLSDARVVQDFFRSEFRNEPIPETRVTYSLNGTQWLASVEAQRQLNDDEFESVNRLPEVRFLLPLSPLGDLGFMVESESSAGYLERTFNRFQRENQGLEGFDAFRAHTENRAYFPFQVDGWLNIIPRAGITYTFYSETLREESVVTTESVTDPDTGVITSTFQTNQVARSASADSRILPEIGLESSFKAYNVLHEGPTGLGTGLRHMVEPFANYTFIPEPDLTPDRIYQFDAIDRLGERHDVRFGVRNKFQTRRPRPNNPFYIHDLANISLSTRYDLRSDADPKLGNLFLDTELRLVDWLAVRFDTEFNTDSSGVETFNTELQFRDPVTRSMLSFDQRYRADARHTLQLTYDLYPQARFGVSGYSRFELENDGFEEQEILFRWETDCVGYGLGLLWIKGDEGLDGPDGDDEYKVWVQFWLTAFPRAILDTGGRR
jgi:LPS-assembly protein